MKWRKGRMSENVEDKKVDQNSRRCSGGHWRARTYRHPSISLLMGLDPSQILQGMQDGTGTTAQQSQLSEEQLNQSVEFVSLVLGDTEATWSEIFKDQLGGATLTPSWCCSREPCSRPAAVQAPLSAPFIAR